MKVSDYIVEFLEKKDITDVFGYPGVGCGHLMESLSNSKINSRLVYHEQSAAFAACAYAQASKRVGVAFTTAGPGGTNLITGIANAYCDSIPTVFIVGNKDLASLKKTYSMRQMTSQEVDIVPIAEPITKWSYQVTDKDEIRYVLEKAFYLANNDRPGPVLLDIPSDIQRAEIEIEELKGYDLPCGVDNVPYIQRVVKELRSARRPLFLVGNGVKQAGVENDILSISNKLNIPIVTTLVCFDLYANEENYIGYIGLDGDVVANKAVQESDLLISFGARLNFKQVCNNRRKFAPNAKVIRIDCDQNELDYKLRDEVEVCADVKFLVPELKRLLENESPLDSSWLKECITGKVDSCRNKAMNDVAANVVNAICNEIPESTPITVDTGSHRRWIMSQFKFKLGQKLYQSAGLVSMGYSLPAAIGVYYATNMQTICFCGDGGIMMNIQELQFIDREKLPITIVVMNNNCLGDIMEFQKKIFAGNYYMTTEETGYLAADFELIAKAFHLNYRRISKPEDIERVKFVGNEPQLIEVMVPSNI